MNTYVVNVMPPYGAVFQREVEADTVADAVGKISLDIPAGATVVRYGALAPAPKTIPKGH